MANPARGRFCFVHCADLHLDTPFSGLGDVAPELAAELREASLDAFDAIVDLALERDAAFLCVAGDVYDGADRGLRAQLRFRDGLARLSAAGIPSFVVHGNHDPLEQGWSAVGSWPELVTIFPTDEAPIVEVVRAGDRLATVQGISYATAATEENLARRLRRPEGPGLHVGLLHCNVEGASNAHANYSPCTLDDLVATELDYLALGHVHQHRVLHGEPGRRPWVVYAGNSQARSPRVTEREAKGAVVVHVEQGAVERVEHVACDRVRFVEFVIDVATVFDLADLHDLLVEHARRGLREADGRSLVVRARLVGRSPLHQDLARPGTIEQLLVALRDEVGTRRPLCWWDALDNDTRGTYDLDQVRERRDFAADLLGLSEELRADGPARDELLESLLTGAPRTLLETARQLLDEEARVQVMLDRAAMLALDQVVDTK